MRRSVLLLGISMVLAACYRTPQLAPGAETVRLTFAQESVRGCQSKGIVQADDGRGGLFGKGQAKRSVDHRLKNAARERGATVVLLAKLTNGFWGSSGTGEAFACGQRIPG